MKAFDSNREDSGVLYRLIRTEKSVQIYVQSKSAPQWDRIEDNGFVCEKAKDISALPESFYEGQQLHFSLLACPTKKVAGEGKNSKRVVIRGEEAQLDWLKRQGEKCGFALLEAHVAGKSEGVFAKKETGELHISGIPFEGVLQINNKEAFIKGFENGIGAEKAYGFGMLMLMKNR